jgi:putative phosphoribosyl transferase
MHVEHTATESPIVVALAPSGTETALEVATALNAHLSVIAVSEVRFADDPMIVLGAVTEFDTMVIDATAVEKSGLDPVQIETLFGRSVHDAAEEAQVHRDVIAQPDVEGRTVVLVDDGAVNPTKLRAALETPYLRGARRVVVATPVARPDIQGALTDACAEFIAIELDRDLAAVGLAYEEYGGPTRDELRRLLIEAAERNLIPTSPAAPGSACVDQEIRIPLSDVALEAHLNVPDDARAIVVLVHGHDSHHRSEHNRSMVRRFNEGLFGTLDVDLYLERERTGGLGTPSISDLARRLEGAIRWLAHRPDCGRYRTVLLGTGTSSAAAVTAHLDPQLAAAVCWAPRLDGVDRATLDQVRTPTLLIVGEHDHPARSAIAELGAIPAAFRTEVLPGIDHTLDETHERSAVVTQALRWFDEHLSFAPAHSAARRRESEGAQS